MKTRFINYALLVILLISCRSNRNLDGRAKPVYFTAANEFAMDTLNPLLSLSYPLVKDLSGSFIQRVEIKPGDTTVVSISEPTLFSFMSTRFLAYPNEHILIKGSVEVPVFMTGNGNKRRDNELMFFNAFNRIQKYPTVPNLINPSLDTILQLEKQQRSSILKADANAQRLFDSLALVFDISEDFRKLAKTYTDNQFDGGLLWIYNLYRDTLNAHGQYFKKLKDLASHFNAIDNDTDFNYNVRRNLNDVVLYLFLNNKTWSIGKERDFIQTFDTMAQNFTGIARGYLLSRLMYRANALGLAVPAAYKKSYRRYNTNLAYREIVRETKREHRQSKRDKGTVSNQMLNASDNKQISLETVLNQHKGKLVFIDLWASWCLPCIQEIPYVKQLVQMYSGKQIVFMSISLDKVIVSWREAIAKYGVKKENNYLLMNANKTAFYKQHKINEIPRFILIGKNGETINEDAPAPSEKELTALIDKVIAEE